MKNLTPNLIINIMKDYDYELTETQAEEVLDLVSDFSYDGRITLVDIEICTNYITNGEDSIFAELF
jgi:dihydroneopterin aldolase